MSDLSATSSNRIRFAQAALLVVDVQRGLFERPTPIYQKQELLAKINSLMNQARLANAPIVIVQHSNENLLKAGTPSWLVHPALDVQAADLHISKQHASAFEKTPLKNELDSRSINTIIVTGLVSQGCVKAVCLDGVKLGYRVVLVKDAHSNYNRQAPQIIQEWNEKLSVAGVELCGACQVDFG